MNQPVNFLGALGVLADPLGAMQQGEERAIINDARRAQTQAYREQVREKVLAARAAREREAKYEQAMQAYLQNPTPNAMSALMVQFPEQAEALSKSWTVQDAGQRQKELELAGNIYASALNGSPDLAADLLDGRIEADISAGQEPDPTDIAVRDMLRSGDPEQVKRAQGILGVGVAAMAGPEKFSETFGKIGEEARSEALHPAAVKEANAKATTAAVEAQYAPKKAEADLQDTQSQIQFRADQTRLGYGRLALDRDRLNFDIDKTVEEMLSKGTEIDPTSSKILGEAVAASQEGFALARQAYDLADRFEASEISGWGVGSGFREFARGVWGGQDAVSDLRKAYVRLRSSAVIKNLPPGSASDTDVKTVLQGFPPETAGREHIASFLRGMAKLEEIKANTEAAKADWISENGNLGKAKRDLIVNGTRVPAGTSFSEFTRSGAAIRRGGEQSPAINTLLNRYGR